MTGGGKAVFLSYASEDSDVAQHIAGALRTAGIEIWLDKDALRGGDAWDASIRQQIRTCFLFLPIVSANSDARLEGYFRREWKLAADRTHDMAAGRPFLVPVAVDSTSDAAALVPEEFRSVQWTRLPDGRATPAFVERIRHLLAGQTEAAAQPPARDTPLAAAEQRSAALGMRTIGIIGLALVVLAAAVYVVAPRLSGRWPPATSRSGTEPQSVAFSPPAHSIAVLPFVNMSGNKEQEYFSDGLTEEILNALAEINELQVAARTSAFSFKGKDTDLGTIARKLNVGAILEGSVRRSGRTVRITAELIDAASGFHLWSKTYDRDLGDVLKLQTELATSVATALKVKLLGDASAKIELGGTRDPAAFDAYLRGVRLFVSPHELGNLPAAVAAYSEAIDRDPHYALAMANRSIALSYGAGGTAIPAAAREGLRKAEADARQAIALAPELAQAHLALATFFEIGALDFNQAAASYERALALAPGNAQVLRRSGRFAAYMGHIDRGLAAARRAVALDPLALDSHAVLGQILSVAHQYKEAAVAFSEGITLDPGGKAFYAYRGLAYVGDGDLERASASCETNRDYEGSRFCLALIYDRLGRHAEADAEVAKLKAADGDMMAYQYATIYAQRGENPVALTWLERALRLRDAGLGALKADPLLDPLRKEPRFQAVERELKFPE